MREIFARASITRIFNVSASSISFSISSTLQTDTIFSSRFETSFDFSFNISSILDNLFLVLMSYSDVAFSKIVSASPISFVITPLLAPRVARSRGRSASVILSGRGFVPHVGRHIINTK